MSFSAPHSPDWNNIDALCVDAVIAHHDEVIFKTPEGDIVISLHDFGARMRFGEKRFGEYEMLLSEPTKNTLSTERSEHTTTIHSGRFELTVQHTPFSFELKEHGKTVQCSPSDAHFVRQFRLPPVAKIDGTWFVSLNLNSSEPVYGLGEKWSKLDRRGQLIRSYNHDALGVNGEISYKNTPFCWSPEGWGLWVHTPAAVTHSVGHAPWSQRAYALAVEDDSADIFLFSSKNGAESIQRYTELTGRAPTPPEWSLGLILSKAYYKDADELLATAHEVRERNLPCDVITIDGRAWQDTDTRFAFEWDATRYPDPKIVIDELKALDFKICIWEYPLVSVENPLFETMSKKGWLLKHKKTGETYRYKWDMSCFDNVLTPLPDSGIVDFTHPDAYAFWREAHKPLFDLGIDMIKADFGEQIEDDMLASNGDCGSKLHNVYSMIYNRCVYEAAQRYCQSGPFLFSRSSWTGSQRYPSQWGGDPQADWGGLAGSIRGGLSWGMSGAPYYASDIGGFYGDQRDDELFVRWCQAAVFSAHMRLHGIGQREPWSYNEASESAANKAIKLRYELLPYIQKTIEASSASGLPTQRAMALACPEERCAWAFEDQFFFGDDILVAPCLNPGGSVEVYLPRSLSDTWVQFPSGKHFSGGQSYKLNLQLDEMATFVPLGRKIPLTQDKKFIAKKTDLMPTTEWEAK